MQPCLAVDQLQQLFGNQIKAVRVAEGLGIGAHLGQLAGGGQQGLDSFDKTVTGQVLFLDDDCRTGLLQLKGIVILMVFGHVRAGDQHRCAAHSLELGQRQCAGAGNDEICRGQQLGHVVDILRHDEVLAGGKVLFLFQPFKQLDAAAAGGVQVKHVPVRLLFPGAEVRHHLVDAVSAQAADYSFETDGTPEYYPSSSYEDVYSSRYNYGGKNVVDYQIPKLEYGQFSTTQTGVMEKIMLPGLQGISAFPETFFVDKNGNIVGETYSGSHTLEEWKEIVEKELSAIKENN